MFNQQKHIVTGEKKIEEFEQLLKRASVSYSPLGAAHKQLHFFVLSVLAAALAHSPGVCALEINST